MHGLILESFPRPDPALAEITPFILTYDEAPNIGRCLAGLNWATEILVIDSGSTDGTLQILSQHPRVRCVQRAFDSHAAQANFALSEVRTDWVLSLDADYLVSPEFVEALRGEERMPNRVGFASFCQCVAGRTLRTSLYPSRAVLFARAGATYVQDGHTQRLRVTGREIVHLPHPLLHDDRKPIARWWRNQRRYAELEAAKLGSVPFRELGWPDQIRWLGGPAPVLTGLYILLFRGSILDGWAGLHYAAERVVVESLLATTLWARRLRSLGAAALAQGTNLVNRLNVC